MAPTKILLTRSLPAQGAEFLIKAKADGLIELVEWTEDCAAERGWLLAELRKGAVEGVICMLGDKVSGRGGCWDGGSLSWELFCS